MKRQRRIEPIIRSHIGAQEYEILPQAILDEAAVVCTVVVRPEHICVRCEDSRDYIMAAAVIRKRSSKKVIRSI